MSASEAPSLRTATFAALAWGLTAGLALAQASDETVINQLPSRGGPAANGPRHNADDRRDGRRGGQLFISPSGEPFRARPGEPYPVVVWFARANKAHDGKLTRAEFVADAEAFFAKVDTDHSGVIDGFENQDYEQKIVPEILPQVGRLNAVDAGYGPDAPGVGREAGTPRKHGGGGGGSPSRHGATYEGAAPYSLINEPQPIMGADADFDQRITLAEFRKAANERFDLLDKKHRGYLTLAELPKTPIQQVSEQIADERKKKSGDHPAGEGSR
jgi:hypothetical protein